MTSNRSVLFRIVFAGFSIFLCLSCGLGVSARQSSDGTYVEAIPVELDAKNPDNRRVGALTYLGGFELRSADSRFGGLSGLLVTPDGSTLYAVSDAGYWVSARMRHDPNGRLTDFDQWTLVPLLTPEGDPVNGRQRDAEGLTLDRDGSFIVSFEQIHRLWRYPPPLAFSAAPLSLPVPAELAWAPNNGGIEGLTVLPDGGLLIIAEEYRNSDGTLKGWLIEEDRFDPLSYLPSDGFHPTDLAALSNGDVLVLERRYSLLGGWAARIQMLPAGSIHPGSPLKGEEIARLEPPLVVDNFEGIAVRQEPNGDTLVYIVSDDNYSSFQRTLLLQFRLEKGAGK